MPTVKSKKKKPKKEVNDGEEQGEGRRQQRLDLQLYAAIWSFFNLFYSPYLICCPAAGLEVEEIADRSPSDSRDPLTPEPQDPAPQKKKKKKRAPTIGICCSLPQRKNLG